MTNSMLWGYADQLTGTSSIWTQQTWQQAWQNAIPHFSIIQGITANAQLVKDIQSQGKTFAYAVSNTYTPDPTFANTADPQVAADWFVSQWQQPFQNTLGGALPDGFHTISIDEFHSCVDGSVCAEASIRALQKLRSLWPTRRIIVAGVWRLGAGGPSADITCYGDPTVTYTKTLNYINSYASLFFLENYQTSANPQFCMFPALIKNINALSPGIATKTIYGIDISTDANNNPKVDFGTFLQSELNTIKADPLASRMPGVGFWIAYRSTPTTIQQISQMV